jgi:pimeloyl-ACP methyl ester carboxylesterase
LTATDLNVVELGAQHGGPVVALVHGSMDRSAGMVRTMRELRDHHVLRYDRRGYGHSSGTGAPPGLDGHVDDLLAVLHGRAAVVVGHSFGGVVGLAAAVRAPSAVLAAVAFESPLSWLPWWPTGSAGGSALRLAPDSGPEAAAEAFVRSLIGDERWEALPPGTRAKRRAEGRALVAELRSVGRGSPAFEPSILDLPLVVGRGTRSADHMQRAANVLAAEAPGAELAVIDGADHGAHLTHPVEFAGLARRALERAAAR